jgi:hypothetical protein
MQFAGILALSGLTFGCGRPETPTSTISPEEARIAAIEEGIRKIIPYKSGVYEFPSENFGAVLGEWKDRHPELMVTAMTQGEDKISGAKTYEATRGSDTFIVNTEPRK